MTTYIATLTVVECIRCGVPFGMTDDYVQRRQRDHASFYCPSGHSQYWPQQSDLDLARKERDNALQRASHLSSLLDDERGQHRKTELRLRSTRGVVTKIKQRIVAGACPKCHARFPDLKHHMEAEHPNYGRITDAYNAVCGIIAELEASGA